MSDGLVISVSEATARVKDRLEEIPRMTVEGEVSNLHPPNVSGHLYFTLGDETAKLSVAFFAYQQRNQKSRGTLPSFKNGDKVRVTGRISVYPPHGSYHLRAENVELSDGVGELLLRFEKLKRQLIDEGLCAAERKRPIALLPKRIGIVTAPTGAAIRDILNVLNRRYPQLHIILSPCRVQGADAVEEIAQAIELLNRHFGPSSDEPMDAMIVGRGGGSLEDLWCFNEERVARAVANSAIPVISAVGHEPDIAITDFVADLRAPTPSAAAELICGRKEDFEKQLFDYKDRLLKALRVGYRDARNRLQVCERATLFRDPSHYLEMRAQRIDIAEHRLESLFQQRLSQLQKAFTEWHFTLEQIGMRCFSEVRQKLELRISTMNHLMEQFIERASNQIATLQVKLEAYNPFDVLKRGYTLTTNTKGEVIVSPEQVQVGESLRVRFAEGAIAVHVDEK